MDSGPELAFTMVVTATTSVLAPAGIHVGTIHAEPGGSPEEVVASARAMLVRYGAPEPERELIRLSDRPERHGTEYRMYGESFAGSWLYVAIMVGP
jgi:hypothetical protein